MISRQQIKLLHVAKTKLGLDDWMYRNLLMRHAGVRSSKDPRMDDIGFRLVMKEFERLGFQRRKREAKVGRVVGGASVAQIEYIQDLWRAITGFRRGSVDFKATLTAWARKHFTLLREFDDLLGILNHLDPRTAHIMIKILKGMNRGKNDAA